ncbi:MAG TPA: DUF885 domain-containing protein [Thermoanaerobaculia bacterium]|nr:DUF885 domain-containing protein [Thermoanaerobaculia bacterium]
MKKVLQPHLGIGAVIFLLTLGIAIPDSPGRARSTAIAMASTRSSELLAKAEKDYWGFLQKRSVSLRLRLGLPIEEVPDLSEQRVIADAQYGASLAEKLRGLREHELTHEESLSLDMLREQARELADARRDYWLTFPVTPYASPERIVEQVFATWRFDTPQDLDRYAVLLTRYATMIRQMENKLREQARRGIRLPKAETSLVGETYRAAIAEPADSLFFVPAVRLERVPEQDRAPFSRRVESLIASRINPALESLAAYVSGDYARKAPGSVGLGQYNGGKAYYRRLVKLHTTLDVSPEEVHELGLAEVERLNRELDEVRAAVGFEGSLVEFRRHLKNDPRFLPATPEDIGERLLEAQKRIESKIPLFFGHTPSAPAGIRRLAPTLEGAMAYGYYQAPTASDRRGYYYYNGSSLKDRSLLNAAALIYRELIPGHHFQISLQQENRELPSFRRESRWTAYTEGWGEYASSLAGEMGMYEDPYDRAGRLMMDAFLSARLVVDTGMNALGWSRARAVAYMKENTLESDAQIATETLRYSCDIPGQALAYKMGAAKIRELRQKAERELRTSFDVRRFHDAVLGSGPMPLATLERHLDWFIDGEKARASAMATR